MVAAAAVLFATLTVGVVIFQVALALGAPWGEYAMAGRFPGRYPSAMRVGALIQAVVIALIGLEVLSDADIVVPAVADGLPWLIWIVVAVSAVGLGLNLISPSAGERRLWVPVASVMLATSLVVALA
jgi:hypothetical protein